MKTPAPTTDLDKRQLWALPSPTPTYTTGLCKSFTLPSGGTLIINNNSTIAFASNIVYQPACSGNPAFLASADNGTEPIDGYRDPFYASVTPLVYVVALTTAMAWLLMITLLLLPASYNGSSSRPLVQAWRRGDGILSLFNSRTSPFPLGNRPFLQRLAALMVVAALTTVTADTFRHAQEQYNSGYSDAMKLRNDVSGSIEVLVIRVTSDLFLWLAQIQTLIRLFPRRKEKLVIKWVGFVLILLDSIFSCLNSFYIDKTNYDSRPRSYRDAIPALSYLFQFALNLLYAAWVFYFVMTKRRYAFYHHMMPEICIVASISLLSILIPVVFFLVDILKEDVSAWGDYFRWVGSAAASIIVWEWVERIEFLEREEKKDGILGREIFEEDDVDDRLMPRGSSRESTTHDEKKSGLERRFQKVRAKYGDVENTFRRFTGNTTPIRATSMKSRQPATTQHSARARRGNRTIASLEHGALQPSIPVPPQATSPIDRDDTNSPGSTVYAIHYHPTTQTPPFADAPTPVSAHQPTKLHFADVDHTDDMLQRNEVNSAPASNELASAQTNRKFPNGIPWRWPANIFQSSRQSPPVEVKKALSQASDQHAKPTAGGLMPKRFGRTLARRNEKNSAAILNDRQPTVIPPPTQGTQPWRPSSMNRVANHSTVISDPRDKSQDDQQTDPGASVTHDFAAHGARFGRTPTSGGNLSGTTAANNSPPEHGASS